MRLWPHLVSLFAISTIVVACNGGNFSGDGGTASAPAPAPTPAPSGEPPAPTPTPPTPPVEECKPDQQAIGANVTFLIDNSASNGGTDCPSPTAIGTFAGSATYQCGAQTNREAAVLNAFDVLSAAAQKDGKDLSRSNVAIVQFPTQANYADGSQMMVGWTATNGDANNRSQIESSLSFARKPFGATPYGAAIDAASRLYASAANDGRGRVAILVTDGEPTDRDPAGTSTKAKQLRDGGVEVITVLVTSGQNRSQRATQHAQMLTSWDQTLMQQGQHWYTQSFSSITQYLDEILGRNGRPSLAQQVASQTDPACVDATNSVCQRYMVETQDSSGLTQVLQQIVKTRVLKCQ